MLGNAHVVHIPPTPKDYFFQTAGLVSKSANIIYAGLGLLKIASLSFEHPLNKYVVLPILIGTWTLGALRANQLIDKSIQYLTLPEEIRGTASKAHLPMSLPPPLRMQKNSKLLSCIKYATYLVDHLPRVLVITIGHGVKYASILALCGAFSLPHLLFLRSENEDPIIYLCCIALFSVQFYPLFIGCYLGMQITYVTFEITIQVINKGPAFLDKLSKEIKQA
jgi:hypothetical protein